MVPYRVCGILDLLLPKPPSSRTRNSGHGPFFAALCLLLCLALESSLALAESTSLINTIELTDEERAWRDAHPRIRAYFEPWPPFLIEQDGEEAGIAVDYLELICRELGIEVEWVHVGWSQALDDIRNHERLDVLPILTRTEERGEYLNFTHDYVSFPIVIFTRRDQNFFTGGLDDLRGRTITVERDYAMHRRLQKLGSAHRLRVVNTTDEALMEVATGGADAYLGNLAVATYVIEKRGLSNLKVAAPAPFGTHDQAMGVRQDWPILASLLDRGLESITPEGHNTIRQRWLAVRYEHGLRRSDIIVWVLGVVGAAAVILALILLWNRRLSREVAERRRAEEALARSQAQLVDAQRLSKLGSWIHDLESDELTWSQETFRIFGRAPELGEPLFEELSQLVHPDDWKAFQTKIRATGRPGDHYEAELRLLQTNGSTKTIICRGGPSISEQSRHDRSRPILVGTVQDVTEARRAEAERARLRNHMTQAQKLESLGVLAGGIAHDFNNILATIMGNTQMTRDEVISDAVNDQTVDYLDEVLLASKKAASLCHQMLAYSGKASFAFEPLDLSELIESMTQMLTISVSKKVTLSFGLTPNPPLIMGDGPQLRQVVLNLVTNASEALAGEAGVISIATKIAHSSDSALPDALGAEDLRPGECVVLQVSDDGCGIDEQTAQRVFEPFFSTRFQGRGLGLAATLGIVRAHRGAISVSSTPEKGSTFQVFLPAVKPRGTLQENAVENTGQTPKGEGLVLVVDDEPQVLKTTSRILEKLGYDTIEAQNGRRALQLFREFENTGLLTAVVLDLIMPEMDGKETFQAIQEINPAIPVVMVSGYDHDELKRRFTSTDGPSAFLRKPFTVEDLAEKLSAILTDTP